MFPVTPQRMKLHLLTELNDSIFGHSKTAGTPRADWEPELSPCGTYPRVSEGRARCLLPLQTSLCLTHLSSPLPSSCRRRCHCHHPRHPSGCSHQEPGGQTPAESPRTGSPQSRHSFAWRTWLAGGKLPASNLSRMAAPSFSPPGLGALGTAWQGRRWLADWRRTCEWSPLCPSGAGRTRGSPPWRPERRKHWEARVAAKLRQRNPPVGVAVVVAAVAAVGLGVGVHVEELSWYRGGGTGSVPGWWGPGGRGRGGGRQDAMVLLSWAVLAVGIWKRKKMTSTVCGNTTFRSSPISRPPASLTNWSNWPCCR